MKKLIGSVHLIIFIIVGIGVYLYMGNALAAESKDNKPIIHMKSGVSYDI